MPHSLATETHFGPVVRIVAFNHAHLLRLVNDIPDADMTAQDKGVVNHPAWTLGHLAIANNFASTMIGAEWVLPEDWRERFGPGSNPTPARDDYPSKQELIDAVERVHAGTMEALERVTNEQLEAPTSNEMLRDICPTVRDAVTFMLTSHVGSHLGQLAAWRGAHGMPRTMG